MIAMQHKRPFVVHVTHTQEFILSVEVLATSEAEAAALVKEVVPDLDVDRSNQFLKSEEGGMHEFFPQCHEQIAFEVDVNGVDPLDEAETQLDVDALDGI
jgi:hypothetical protein